MSLARNIRRIATSLLGRNFESAGGGSRWPLTVGMASPARQALAARSLAASRVNWLVANTGIAEAIVSNYATALVGSDGPSARSGHRNRAMQQALDDAWSDAFDSFSIDGSDLTSIMSQACRSLVGNGEALLRFITTERGEVKVVALLPEQLDASVNSESPRVVAGVEVDGLGRIVAYHIRPSPDDYRAAGQSVRVGAADVVHLFERRWPGQVRGISWLANVATSIVELDALQDAALMKAKASALLCGLIRNIDGASSTATDMQALQPMEPGALVELPGGTDVVFTPTSDMAALDAFVRHMTRVVAAGVGVPYELVAGDLSQVNYSSAKLGLEAFKRRVKGIRSSILVAGFLRPLWHRFVTLEILSGRINAPDFARDPKPFFAVNFLFPEWAALDPLKEAQADVLLMRAGIRSRQEIIAGRGRDPGEVDAEIDSDVHADMANNVTPLRPSLESEAA